MATTNKTRGPGAKKRLLAYLLANVGKVLNSADLQIASGNASEWARRIRELRDEQGFRIITHNDRSDLKPGQYMLLDPKPVPAFARSISKETRAIVLERNGFTCQMCGAAAGEPHPYDPSKITRLHIGHIVDKSMGGSDEVSNLKAICSVCNEGAQNTTPIRPDLKHLLVQIRRAASIDQLATLEWLIKKYPSQATNFLNQKSKRE